MAINYLKTGLQTVDMLQGFIDDDKADQSSVQDSEGYSIANGRLIEDINLANTGFASISHKLGRVYKGYAIVKKNADATVWSQESSDDAAFIDLQASAAVTVSLWVF